MLKKSVEISKNNFYCEKCDYKCCRKVDYNRHLQTNKHNAQKCSKNVESSTYICECGKKYKHIQSFRRHKKSCSFVEECENQLVPINNDSDIEKCVENEESNDVLKNLVYKLITENNEIKQTMINENKELRKQLTEMIPKMGSNNTTTNNTNNINQKFNIQVFLNDKCKDALNMKDFIKSIEISVEQLDFTKRKGLAAGLTNAIVENMNKLSLYERPLHCTDLKRETLYIKENDIWEKDKDKTKIKEAIKKASGKNYNALQSWKTINPDFQENEDKSEFFARVISTIGKNTDTVDDKVIKSLCSSTYIKDSLE